MAVSAEFQAALNRLDTETNEIAAEVLKLRETISTSMTPEEVASAQAFLTAVSDRLDGIAKDPNAPVPPGPTPEL